MVYISLLLLSMNFSYACTCFPWTLCLLVESEQNVLVVKGIKLEEDSISLKLQITDVLRGNENRDTIMIWESYMTLADTFCYLPVGYGEEIGDTMIIAVNPIDSLTTWGDRSDYIFINYYCATSSLIYENDSVKGLIRNLYPNWGKMPYSQFKSNFNDLMSNCPTFTDIKTSKKSDVKLYPNPVYSSLIIEFENYKPIGTVIRLFNLKGQVLYNAKVNNAKTSLDLSFLDSGCYIIEIINDGFEERRKIIVE